MTRSVLIAYMLSIAVSLQLPARAQQTEAIGQWAVLGTQRSGTIDSQHDYGLENLVIMQSIKYRKRKYGIYLVWDKHNEGFNLQFERASDSKNKGPLKYGELFAIQVRGHGYIHYQKRGDQRQLEFPCCLTQECYRGSWHRPHAGLSVASWLRATVH
jgi:hypothetical protein